MSFDAFDARRKSLEEEFFAKQNEKLKQKLKDVFERTATRESLKAATGVTNDAVLDMLLALNVTHESMAAFALFPLVAVAWADGRLDDREREALIAATRERGITTGTPAALLLEEWLQHPPGPDGVKAWYAYTKELNQTLDPAQRRTVRDELCRRTRAVAEASGGFLGLGTKVSAKEEEILKKLNDAFEG